ncbi:type 1 glutamine amidotransferase [Aliisedimentitalea scapharcae]|uniref:Type 1 glutamine amidotransferase n=1 Tax=Aliisedimentitalea scapharcae TaxID=1524259 RepID=A0ABZ2XX69_9RHOB
MTNTDESDFAQRHPKDGEKFTNLVQLVRPDWTCAVFAVKDGIFPDDVMKFDGVMITGSPASVRSGEPWVDQLLGLIREIDAQKLPMFGACFGHQAIAVALGGTLDHNPQGWVHGLTRNRVCARPPWARDLPDELRLYGSHVEQVSTLPPDVQTIATSGETITGFARGQHIYTTQHHPEMDSGFIAALTDELRDTLGPEVHDRARASLSEMADQQAFAESVARFFEHAS